MVNGISTFDENRNLRSSTAEKKEEELQNALDQAEDQMTP